MVKLTKAQLHRLRQAAGSESGVINFEGRVGGFGLAQVARPIKKMVTMGLMTEYVHGGWQITDLGRSALKELDT